MTGYGYNFEDVYIQRLSPGRTDGFCIDVGAAHPVEGTATKALPRPGLAGIDIEPQDALYLRVPVEATSPWTTAGRQGSGAGMRREPAET